CCCDRTCECLGGWQPPRTAAPGGPREHQPTAASFNENCTSPASSPFGLPSTSPLRTIQVRPLKVSDAPSQLSLVIPFAVSSGIRAKALGLTPLTSTAPLVMVFRLVSSMTVIVTVLAPAISVASTPS